MEYQNRKKKYDHCRQQNETKLLRDDVIIKLVVVKDIIRINTNQPFTVSYYYDDVWLFVRNSLINVFLINRLVIDSSNQTTIKAGLVSYLIR